MKVKISMLKLKCKKCGVEYEKPADFKKWNDERPDVFFKWNLTLCDTCRHEREKEAIKMLPEIIKRLVARASDETLNEVEKG